MYEHLELCLYSKRMEDVQSASFVLRVRPACSRSCFLEEPKLRSGVTGRAWPSSPVCRWPQRSKVMRQPKFTAFDALMCVLSLVLIAAGTWAHYS
jgi:hypothetical protein